MHRYSVLPIIRTEIPLKDGTVPICLKVRINGKAKPLMINEYILPKHWNKSTRRVKLAPGDILKECEINDIIILKLEIIESIFRKARASTMPLTMDNFLKIYLNQDTLDNVVAYLSKVSNGRKNRKEISLGSFVIESRAINRLKEFAPRLKFTEMNNLFIREFNAWLVEEYDYDHNTVILLNKKIRKYINDVIDEGLNMVNPYKGMKLQAIDSDPVFLEPDELHQWIKLYDEDCIRGRYREVLEASILCAVNGGFRISDWRLGKNNLTGNLLTFCPYKTERKKRKLVRFELNEIGKEILKHRRNNDCFFDLPSDVHINKMLHELCRFTKIKKNITAHVFRHTFATNYIDQKGSLTDLQDIMGHSELRTTEKYVHIIKRSQQQSSKLMNVFRLPKKQDEEYNHQGHQ